MACSIVMWRDSAAITHRQCSWLKTIKALKREAHFRLRWFWQSADGYLSSSWFWPSLQREAMGDVIQLALQKGEGAILQRPHSNNLGLKIDVERGAGTACWSHRFGKQKVVCESRHTCGEMAWFAALMGLVMREARGRAGNQMIVPDSSNRDYRRKT